MIVHRKKLNAFSGIKVIKRRIFLKPLTFIFSVFSFCGNKTEITVSNFIVRTERRTGQLTAFHYMGTLKAGDDLQ